MQQSVTYQYVQAVKAIKQAIQVSRYRVSRHANGVSLGLYYGVGKYISEHSRNAAWGTGAIEHISSQLQQEMPGLIGFSAQNMRRMRQFYEEWVEVFENCSAVPNELGIIPISADIQTFTFCSSVMSEISEHENPSIGIILCRDKNNTEVEFALRDMSKPLGVATYRSVDELPEQYRSLPSVDELRELM